MNNSESIIFTPKQLGRVELKNRTIRSAAFEGMARNNKPTQQLKDYHVSVAKGGAGMTTLAYASVNRSGLSFDTQLWMKDDIIPDLADLADAVHKEGCALSVQVGHCGNMTHYRTAGQMPVAATTGFNLYSPTIHRKLKSSELVDFAKDFGHSVEIAAKAGLDAVEIHAGHGYLISQFLSPYTNRRRDEYGGSLEKRMRFMNMCLSEVMDKAKKHNISVLVKTNMRDGFKGGLEIDENIEITKQIATFDVDGIVLSGGFVSRSPMYVMRGRIPIKSMTHYMKPWWLKWGVSMLGNQMIKKLPFEEAYFLEDALKFKKAIDAPFIYVGGLVRKSKIEEVINHGFDFVQMGRAFISMPDFVNRMKEGTSFCECDHHNYCIARMYSVDMRCCKHIKPELPNKIIKELGI